MRRSLIHGYACLQPVFRHAVPHATLTLEKVATYRRFGGDIDGYNSYAQRGNLATVEDVCEGGMALMPMIGRARVLRHWGGIMDMSMDGSPIIDRTPVDGLFLNAGWFRQDIDSPRTTRSPS